MFMFTILMGKSVHKENRFEFKSSYDKSCTWRVPPPSKIEDHFKPQIDCVGEAKARTTLLWHRDNFETLIYEKGITSNSENDNTCKMFINYTINWKANETKKLNPKKKV
ncbi:hypothetical protein RJT34_27046 [Clitoria ternatea]|uniref:Uncharacterized protein n=1 Tax=Clitoria ternatea TaxID=43366 RepID=A0AAN9FG36_CLITE